MKFETLRLMAQDYADRHKEPPPLPVTIDTMAYAYQRICQEEASLGGPCVLEGHVTLLIASATSLLRLILAMLRHMPTIWVANSRTRLICHLCFII